MTTAIVSVLVLPPKRLGVIDYRFAYAKKFLAACPAEGFRTDAGTNLWFWRKRKDSWTSEAIRGCAESPTTDWLDGSVELNEYTFAHYPVGDRCRVFADAGVI